MKNRFVISSAVAAAMSLASATAAFAHTGTVQDPLPTSVLQLIGINVKAITTPSPVAGTDCSYNGFRSLVKGKVAYVAASPALPAGTPPGAYCFAASYIDQAMAAK